MFLNQRRTIVICADFESLVSSHDQSCLAIFFVLEQPNITSAPLLPLPRVTVELEQLSAHLEDLLLSFLVGLGLNLFSQTDNRHELDIGFLFVCLVLIINLVSSAPMQMLPECSLHRRHLS